MLEVSENLNAEAAQTVSPLEKQVWKTLWKLKTTPKLRHFLWRVFSGALAVKDRLRSQGIRLDPTCTSCGLAAEDIGHVLFHCRFAKDVWELSSIPMPPSGSWSNSVFLNLYHLFSLSKNPTVSSEGIETFPWILWNIWKARNSFCFEHTRLDPAVVFDKARVEAEIWKELNIPSQNATGSAVRASSSDVRWSRPPRDWFKCNVASSWSYQVSNSGAAWILRDWDGNTILHSRRSFSRSSSQFETELSTLLWSVESLVSLRVEKIIIDTSSGALHSSLSQTNLPPLESELVAKIFSCLSSLKEWKIELTSVGCNKAATSIADSVTRDRRYQSYVASGGPTWLRSLLQLEGLPS